MFGFYAWFDGGDVGRKWLVLEIVDELVTILGSHGNSFSLWKIFAMFDFAESTTWSSDHKIDGKVLTFSPTVFLDSVN